MAHEKIVTLFDTVQQANDARRELEAAGFANHDISIISGEGGPAIGRKSDSLWVDEDGLPNEERNGALDPRRDPKRK